MSFNFMISLLALTVIMASLNQIETAPTGTAKPSTSRDYYLTRAWGESSIPFTVIYSNYGRSQSVTTTSTTVAPTAHNRRKNATKKPSQLPNLFVSNGWGPIG